MEAIRLENNNDKNRNRRFGISGLMAAYTLSPRHEVELFESNHRAGGHANTVLVNDVGTPTPIDTGFIVFNEQNYPVLCSLRPARCCLSRQ